MWQLNLIARFSPSGETPGRVQVPVCWFMKTLKVIQRSDRGQPQPPKK